MSVVCMKYRGEVRILKIDTTGVVLVTRDGSKIERCDQFLKKGSFFDPTDATNVLFKGKKVLNVRIRQVRGY